MIDFISEEKQKAEARLWQMLEDDEYYYHVFPHSGLAPDWRVWYWDLHNAVRDYLQVE